MYKDFQTATKSKNLVGFQTQGSSKSGGESTESGSGMNTLSTKTELQFETDSPTSIKASSSDHHHAFDQHHLQLQQQKQHQLQHEKTTDHDASKADPPQNQPAAKSAQEKVFLNKHFFLLLISKFYLFLPFHINKGRVSAYLDTKYKITIKQNLLWTEIISLIF